MTLMIPKPKISSSHKIKKILLLIIFNIIISIFLIKFLPNNTKVEIRFALFSKNVSRRKFEEEKNRLINDTSDSLNSKNNIWEIYKYKNTNTLSTILSKFSDFKSSDYCGKYSTNLTNNINIVLAGYGCCSDFSQVFIALCNLNKIPVCEIGNLNHTFNEVYEPKTKKIIWIDMQNKLIAKDTLGKFLSTFEIYDNFINNHKIEIFSFVGEKDIFNSLKINTPVYFKKDFFQTLILTNYKNVLEVDTKYSVLNFLPIELNQLIFSIYNYPLFLVYDQHNIFWIRVLKMRFYLITFVCLLLLINFYLFIRFVYKK